MASGTARPATLRHLIASLLRLAGADADDALLLLDAGRPRNAAGLARAAITHLVGAVAASEQGQEASPEISSIDPANPLRGALARLHRYAPPPAMRQGSRIAGPPDAEGLREILQATQTMLARLCEHFGVDPQGTDAARHAAPLRPGPAPRPARRRTARADGPSPRARDGGHRRLAGSSHSGISSVTLWLLADRWGLPDADMLQAVGSTKALAKAGARPRFKLTPGQREILSAMLSLDEAMDGLGLDKRRWLSAPAAPFQGARPADIIRGRQLQGVRDVTRHVAATALRQSLESS